MKGGDQNKVNLVKLRKHIGDVFSEIDKKYEGDNKKINSKLDIISNRVEKTNLKLSSLSKRIIKIGESGIF